MNVYDSYKDERGGEEGRRLVLPMHTFGDPDLGKLWFPVGRVYRVGNFIKRTTRYIYLYRGVCIGERKVKRETPLNCS